MKKSRVMLFVALMLSFVLAGCIDLYDGEEYREEFRETYTLEPGGQVSLENLNGSARIATWERDEVLIEAEKVVRASSLRKAKRLAEELRIDVDAEPTGVWISTVYPRRSGFVTRLLSGGINAHVRYTLTIPTRADLIVKLTNGRIEVEGVEGEVDAETVNGAVRLYDCAGTVRAKSVNGALRAEIRRLQPTDHVDMSAVNGSLRLYLPEDAQADIEARTVNGSVRTRFEDIEVRERSRKRMTFSLNGGGAEVELKTINGSIQILPLP